MHLEGRENRVIQPKKPKHKETCPLQPRRCGTMSQIAKNPEDVYKYTAKGNLVGVISNGTAVLGLGILVQKGKPVMEGKGVLFKNIRRY